jgi:hypothetical protein
VKCDNDDNGRRDGDGGGEGKGDGNGDGDGDGDGVETLPPLSAILTLIGDCTDSYVKSYREISYIGAEIFYIGRVKISDLCKKVQLN